MTETHLLWVCILVSIVGIAVIAGIIWFGRLIFRTQIEKKFSSHRFWDVLIHGNLKDRHTHDDIPRYVYEGYSEYLQRRNEFWTTYGQVLIAVLIAIVLSILLLTKTISAEAGLPILSGISGFAIAKGVSGAKTISIPKERPRG